MEVKYFYPSQARARVRVCICTISSYGALVSEVSLAVLMVLQHDGVKNLSIDAKRRATETTTDSTKMKQSWSRFKFPLSVSDIVDMNC